MYAFIYLFSLCSEITYSSHQLVCIWYILILLEFIFIQFINFILIEDLQYAGCSNSYFD